MYLEFDEFDKITTSAGKVFSVWEDQFDQFREVLRELAKKRNQEKVPLRVTVETKPLQERIVNLKKFRRQVFFLFFFFFSNKPTC